MLWVLGLPIESNASESFYHVSVKVADGFAVYINCWAKSELCIRL